MKKLINQDVLENITSKVIGILVTNKCTLYDFREVSDKVHQFYQDNATVNSISSKQTSTENQIRHHQQLDTNDQRQKL